MRAIVELNTNLVKEEVTAAVVAKQRHEREAFRIVGRINVVVGARVVDQGKALPKKKPLLF